MKDMTSMATTMMTEEEKAEIEKEMNIGNPKAGVTSITAEANKPAPTATTSAEPLSNGETKTSKTAEPSDSPTSPTNGPSGVKDNATVPPSSTAPTPIKTAAEKEREKQEQARRRAEQREKLREHEIVRRKALQERVKTLTEKMIERLRPFVEAKNPGAEGDTETTAFTEKMKREVEDLKLESFGIEVCIDHFLFSFWFFDQAMLVVIAHDWEHLHYESHIVYEVPQVLGHVSIRFLIQRSVTEKMYSPGFFSRLKEKGTFAKDVWGVIGTALSVRDLMMVRTRFLV